MTNFSQPLSYPRAESNRNRQNRNLKFYPLNYGGNEVAKIRTASDKQEVSVKEIESRVEEINDVIQTNSAAAQQTSAMSEELTASATSLDGLIGEFKIRK